MRSIPPEGYHPGGAHKEKVVAIENKLSQQSPYPYSRCVSQRCGPLPLNKEKAPFHPSPFSPYRGIMYKFVGTLRTLHLTYVPGWQKIGIHMS